MYAKLVKEALNISIPSLNEVPEDEMWDYFAKLVSLFPSTNKRLRARMISHVIFDAGTIKEDEVKIKTNYLRHKGEQLLQEHIIGKQKAGEIISKYVDKYGNIDANKLRELLHAFAGYIYIPKRDVNNVKINDKLRPLQNQSSIITYEEYINKLKEFIVETSNGEQPLEIIEGTDVLRKYIDNVHATIKKYKL